MLLAALFVSVAGAAPPRIEMCRQKFTVTVETAEPVLGAGGVITTDSCGSGIQYPIVDERTREAVAYVRIEKKDGRRVHLRIDNVRKEVVLERRDIPLDEAVTVRFADNGRELDARVLARTAEPPTQGHVSIDAVNLPLNVVVRELQSATGWKIDGIDRLKDERVTFRFDEFAIRALLTIASDLSDTELVIERDGEAEFRPREGGS
jgi:hypothetical protein